MRLRKLKRRPGGGPPGASAPGHSSREATAPPRPAGAPRCPTVLSQRSNRTPQGHSRMPSAETLPLPTERSWRVRQTKFELESQTEEERKRRGKEKGIPFVSNPPTHHLGVRACSTRVLRGRPGAWLCTPTRTCAHTCAHVHTCTHSHVHTRPHMCTRARTRVHPGTFSPASSAAAGSLSSEPGRVRTAGQPANGFTSLPGATSHARRSGLLVRSAHSGDGEEGSEGGVT